MALKNVIASSTISVLSAKKQRTHLKILNVDQQKEKHPIFKMLDDKIIYNLDQKQGQDPLYGFLKEVKGNHKL